jgi:peroxiredoxin
MSTLGRRRPPQEGQDMPLEPGDKAPDFTLLDQNGEKFSHKQSLKEKKVWRFVYSCPEATRS